MNSVLLSEYAIFSYLFNKKFVSYKLRLKIQYVAPPLLFPYFKTGVGVHKLRTGVVWCLSQVINFSEVLVVVYYSVLGIVNVNIRHVRLTSG